MSTPSPGRRTTFLTIAAPMVAPIVIVVSLAALHTAFNGGPIGGWGALYAVLAVVGIVVQLARGPRHLPPWLEVGWIPIVIAMGVLLTITEWLALLTLAIGIALFVLIGRSPPRTTPLPPPQPFQRPAAPPVWAAATPAAAVAGPVGAAPPPPAGPVDPVTIVVVPPWARGLLLGVGLLFLGGTVAMNVAAWTVPDLPIAARIAISVGSLFSLGFGLAATWGGIAIRRTRYEIDHLGIRRIGNSPWAITWGEIRAIGLRRHDWIVPDDLTPTPTALRRRRRSWLVIDPVDHHAPSMQPLREIIDLPGFTRGDLVPEITFGRTNPSIDQLAESLARIVPERFVGVMSEGRPVRR